MRKMISGLVDGTLRGIIVVYARFHIERCARCKSALVALHELRERLRLACAPSDANVLDPARAAGLSTKLDEIDATTAKITPNH
jgi:hypothetical protein